MNQDELDDGLDVLLRDCCVRLGFCSPIERDDLVGPEGEVTAEWFAAVVLRAEGMNPVTEERWRTVLAAEFQSRFGHR